MKKGRKIPNIFVFKINNKAKSHIRKVIDSNGDEITDHGNILKEIKCFYGNFFSRKSLKQKRIV